MFPTQVVFTQPQPATQVMILSEDKVRRIMALSSQSIPEKPRAFAESVVTRLSEIKKDLILEVFGEGRALPIVARENHLTVAEVKAYLRSAAVTFNLARVLPDLKARMFSAVS